MIDTPLWISEVQNALREDAVSHDVTTQAVINGSVTTGYGRVIAKQEGVFSGAALVHAMAKLLPVKIERVVNDGTSLQASEEAAVIEGPVRVLLGMERTLLNYLSHLSGVASLTRRYVEAVKPHPTKILATRKTLPGLRDLQLKAVEAGGGHIHRRSLEDGILIKDNHLMFVDIATAIKRARAASSPLHRVEVEVNTLAQLEEALASGPDVVMLDNFDATDLLAAVRLIKNRCEIEISGGVDLENVRKLAELGVHYISVGRLTHSAPSLDLSLDITHA